MELLVILLHVLLKSSLSLLLLIKGRALSRAKSRRTLGYEDVLGSLAEKGIAIRVASPKLVMEEVSCLYNYYNNLFVE